MKGTIIRSLFFILSIFLITSCNKTYKVTTSYLSGKTFDNKGYAEDQLSSEEIKANPDIAKSFLTSLGSINFIDETHVTVSYWSNGQATISSKGTYTISSNEIIMHLEKLGAIFGQVFKLESTNTLTSNGQLGKFELKK